MLKPESVQRRMITHILEMEQPKQIRQVLFEEDRYTQRKAWLKDKSMSSQNTELLPEESDKPMPSLIGRDLKRFTCARMVAKQDAS